MEFQEDQIVDLGLNEDQVLKLQSLTSDYEAELKQSWDGKANSDAEAILQGAADKVEALTGIKRDQGVKIADYLGIASESYVKGSKSSYEAKIAELDEKIKNGKPDPILQQQLDEAKSKLDVFLQKEAKFEDWEKNDWKGKYEQASTELSNYKLNAAFGSIKPNFPDTVNAYEAKGRWNEFVEDVKSNYDIKEDGGEYIAVSKENVHKVYKLKDLLEKNDAILELSKGRKIDGIGSKAKDKIKIDGVPFEIPENANASERTKAIKEYITGELKLPHTSREYAAKFAELNKILLEKNPHK